MAGRCLTFLGQIGIAADWLSDEEEQLLSGLAIVQGRLLIDPNLPIWPGDLLHEAGHIAVAAPADRPTLGPIEADGADEMAAIAWSYAAAKACDVNLEHLFHDGGYRGDSQSLRSAFAGGGNVGVPMLQYFGMAAHHDDTSAPPFPAMLRWLR